jgi:hypothetical protein
MLGASYGDSMDIRTQPIGQGLAWFKQAFDLGARNPRAVFGAALLLILALYAVALVAAVAAVAFVGDSTQAGKAPPIGTVLMVGLPLFLAIMLVVPILIGGLMHVIREAEAGHPVRARDVFAPLRSAAGRRLALLGLVQMALAIGSGLVVVAVAGDDYWRDYMAAMQGAMQGRIDVMPQPENAGLLMLIQIAFNYFSYVLMLFSIPSMLFSGVRLGEALSASLKAGVRNIGAYLLAGLLFVGALLLATLVFALVVLLAGLVASAIHPLVGEALTALLALGFAAIVLVLLVGGAYLAWRDTFGDAAVPPATTLAPHEIEV